MGVDELKELYSPEDLGFLPYVPHANDMHLIDFHAEFHSQNYEILCKRKAVYLGQW